MNEVQKTHIKAYGIFDGGGVLGAALAGALKAAEDYGIHFVGYGGTSAGSMIATLGAVGMSGEQIQEAILETPFADFLDQRGDHVSQFKSHVNGLMSSIQKLRLWNCPWRLWSIVRHSRTVSKAISDTLGIDDGKTLRNQLHDLIGRQHPQWKREKTPEITFEMLEKTPGCFPLKIVASDITKRKPVEFSAKKTQYGNSVLNAVRASTCYPFVFKPFEVQQRRLVDGGLSSNLPASLFHQEQQITRHPVFAFDLIQEETEPPATYSFSTYIKDMAATAIDAGDEFLRDVLDGVYHILISIPKEYDSLDFSINRDRRYQLFRIGYAQTMECLQKQPFLKFFASHTGERIQHELQLQFGPPHLYQPVLAALVRDIERISKAKNIRATIMLPTGRGTRIVAYSHGMNRLKANGSLSYDTDYDLEIDQNAGISGSAWKTGKSVLADITSSRQNPEAWGLTQIQNSKIPENRRAMLSFPIPRHDVPILSALDDNPHEKLLGTLTLDSTTNLDDTLWTDGLSTSTTRPEVVEVVQIWLPIIQRLLFFNN